MTIRTRPSLFRRNGLSLIEILIALTMTLIVLGAMMTAFGFASTQMRMGRAVMEMANRVRSVEDLLRIDLANNTVDIRPYTDTTPPNGYFEYIEGPLRDKDTAFTINTYLGDVDDIIGMTCRSAGQLYRGRLGNEVIESSLAEIVWFTTFDDRDGNGVVDFNGDSIRIHRRVLLIRPELGTLVSAGNPDEVNYFLATNDISCRIVSADATNSSFDVIANRLGDLAIRKNRFCHVFDPYDIVADGHRYPNVLDRNFLNLRQSRSGPFPGILNSDDFLLADVAGFDVKVYSPNAMVKIDLDIVVDPSDVGYLDSGEPIQPLGAYVDLDFVDLNPDGGSWFAATGVGHPLRRYKYNFPLVDFPDPLFAESAYDGLTPFYESDGVDTDRSGLVDQGTNGLNDGGTPAPDDNSERETTAPYPYPVRGIKVSIRVIEKGTKQVHQSSIIHSFVPE